MWTTESKGQKGVNGIADFMWITTISHVLNMLRLLANVLMSHTLSKLDGWIQFFFREKCRQVAQAAVVVDNAVFEPSFIWRYRRWRNR